MINSYPKIYAIGHRAVKELFNEEVSITEKVDGSQISFGVFGGVLMVKSRNHNLVIDEPEKMFANAIVAIQGVQHKLTEGWTYRGEYLTKPKHNTLAYERVPTNHIILFDINIGLENYLSWEEVHAEGIQVGFETVPLVFKGKVDDPEILLELLKRKSTLGLADVEGIVVKNYDRFNPFDGKCLMGKYVSEAFKEVHQGEWKKNNPSGGDFLQVLGAKYRSEARWHKSIQRLRDDGTLLDDPKDIGGLLRDIQADIKHECEDEIKEALFKWAWGKIARQSIAGFPEFYKELLLRQQFVGVAITPEDTAECAEVNSTGKAFQVISASDNIKEDAHSGADICNHD
jgi:hypothetical protein